MNRQPHHQPFRENGNRRYTGRDRRRNPGMELGTRRSQRQTPALQPHAGHAGHGNKTEGNHQANALETQQSNTTKRRKRLQVPRMVPQGRVCPEDRTSLKDKPSDRWPEVTIHPPAQPALDPCTRTAALTSSKSISTKSIYFSPHEEIIPIHGATRFKQLKQPLHTGNHPPVELQEKTQSHSHPRYPQG